LDLGTATADTDETDDDGEDGDNDSADALLLRKESDGLDGVPLGDRMKSSSFSANVLNGSSMKTRSIGTRA